MMSNPPQLPDDFTDHLSIANAAERLREAAEVAGKIQSAGVPLQVNPDHAAIFTDPPYLVAGPLKKLGYRNGWDARCYPSPVDGQDFINVSSRLEPGSSNREHGWFDYVAVVHPVDQAAREQMLSHGYGNPFIHHLTWGIIPPERKDADDFTYAGQLVAFMVKTRSRIAQALNEQPGTLICALPHQVVSHPEFEVSQSEWLAGCPAGEYQFEAMQGDGYLIQFFVLSGGRIEVALRVDTTQTFNPKSVDKISRDEISTDQDLM